MWIFVLNGLAYLTYGIFTGRFRQKLFPICSTPCSLSRIGEGGLRMKPQTWRRAVPILISPAPIEPMVPIFSRKQGDFQEKQGGDLSTNGQSLRGIRDLDDFSKSK